MAENRYAIARFAPPGRNLERVEISIVRYQLRRTVTHWNLFNVLSRFWLVYWNDTPGATLELQNSSIEITPGKLILIAPYTLVTGHTHQPFVHNFVQFEAPPPFNSVRYEPMIFPTGEYAPDLPPDADKVRKSLGLYAMVERLLLKVTEGGSPLKQELFEPRIRESLKYIDDNCMKKYSVSELCRHVNLSPSRFLHLFKEQTGLSPRDYWLQQRIGLVLKLLTTTELSIPEIATELGFVDRTHLSRVIKANIGETPAEIRKKILKSSR